MTQAQPVPAELDSRHIPATQSYATWYTNCYKRTVALLRSRGACEEDASEFAQAAWVKGWESLHQLRDQGRVLPWVNSIAINLYRSALVLNHRESTLSEKIPAPAGELRACEVRCLLERCKREDSEILVLRYWRGLSIQEISQKRNWSNGATRIKLFRARRSLKVELEKGGAHPPPRKLPDVFD